MLSSLFKSKRERGTGYGGSRFHDHRKLKKGRQKTAVAESTRDADTLRYLIATGYLLRTKSLTDTSKLVSTLGNVFCNQVPTDWDKQKKLLLVSLTCLRLLLQNYSEKLLDDDAASLKYAFDEFAQQAHFLNKHNEATGHALMVEKVLQVQSLLTGQRNELDDMDPKVEYRKTLGPLRFEFCDSLKNHSFASQSQSAKLNIRSLFQELSAYKTALPVEFGSSIFVRAVEGRLDLLRALIIGPEDTPYANGCFVFDIWIKDYPNQPPKVHFLTTGENRINFNPNLYSNGKVCLSLLGTWPGPGWVKGESTLLQVLVSLQSLVFVAEPLYNEPLPGLLQNLGVFHQRSVAYNATIRRHTLQHAILPYIRGDKPLLPYIRGDKPLYPEFQKVIQQHFRLKRTSLKQQMRNWTVDDPSLSRLVETVVGRLHYMTRRGKRDKSHVQVDESPLRKKQKTHNMS